MSWRTRRRWDVEHRILHELDHEHWCYLLDVMRRTGLRAGQVYPAIDRLETHGHVVSKWEEGPPNPFTDGARRRMYRLATEEAS